MADAITEIKLSIERLIERTVGAMNATRGVDLPSPVLSPTNSLGARVDATTADAFATGYDGTNTVIPFMRGVSGWNTDIWTN